MESFNETQYPANVTDAYPAETTTPFLTYFMRYPVALMTFAGVTCIIFSIVGVFGNFVTAVALARCTRLRNATTAFIVNLACVDFFFCAFSMPLVAVTFLERVWNYGPHLCKVFSMVEYFNGALSLFSVMAITINRYILIVHPKRYNSIYRFRNVGFMIATVYLIAFSFVFPPLAEIWGKFGYDPKIGRCTILMHNGKSPKTYIFSVALLAPSLTFILSYPRIYWVVRKSSMSVNTHETSGVPQEKPKGCFNMFNFPNLAPKQRKELMVLKVMTVIFLVNVICYFPMSFVRILKKEEELATLNVIGYLLVYMSNCINPIIYVAISREYRQAYAQLFACKPVFVFLSSSSSGVTNVVSSNTER